MSAGDAPVDPPADPSAQRPAHPSVRLRPTML